MSRHVLERVLHQLTVDRAAKQRFRENAPSFVARFALSEAERTMIVSFDVASLQKAGVNPMLTMGFWQELSPHGDMRVYMQRLRPVTDGETVYVAAIKQ
ncbi:extradiol ring-cleavage dioxygenase [Paraburkholderia sp. BL27I4N3]|uniref:extradiol ring-cleavage dioxygenase n=1 Tax=Paraburkholderia sp. BL27I4N3 TaxID=1938805 RepID=UPI000E2655A5|nr:extradiol ring-cleavage dioxygenase [Paraburkholderia sp. BL27I4N3]